MRVCRVCFIRMLRVYRSIRKEFIRNIDGILQNNFHLKSSFDKTKYIFDLLFSNTKCSV